MYRADDSHQSWVYSTIASEGLEAVYMAGRIDETNHIAYIMKMKYSVNRV